MKTKIFLIIIAALFLIQWKCSFGTDKPPFKVNLWVPYHAQECQKWCGIACIQMWADMDGYYVTQGEIANYLGVGNQRVSPFLSVIGVGYYTCAPGWLEIRDWFDLGAKGDLIASSITGIKYGYPSIMPFHDGEHAVLIKGYSWQEVDSKPIAISCIYHDPDPVIGPEQEITARRLSRYFECGIYDYWVIVGFRDFVWEGMAGHQAFIEAGGTYYGGPQTYDPFTFQQ